MSESHEQQATHATDEFCMVWQNDQDVYLEVVGMTRDLIRLYPGMTDQTLGRNIKDRVFAWAYGGGWGYSSGWGGAVSSLLDSDRYPDWSEGGPPQGYRVSPFSYFLSREQYGWVSEERIAEEARDALGLEGYDPSTGNPQ
jgi:hypothetical protein